LRCLDCVPLRLGCLARWAAGCLRLMFQRLARAAASVLCPALLPLQRRRPERWVVGLLRLDFAHFARDPASSPARNAR